MRRVASRSAIALLLALLLVTGIGFFVAEYVMKAESWVMSPGSPHVYNAGNIGCGTVLDRDGTVLLDMTDGRTYASSLDLRKTTVHWLGDRYGAVFLFTPSPFFSRPFPTVPLWQPSTLAIWQSFRPS